MTGKHLMIIGYGFSGFEIAKQSLADFETITCTNRSKRVEVASWEAALNRVVFDGETMSETLTTCLTKATHLIVSIAPGESGDIVINTCSRVLAANPNLRWIGYLSTVGVYGNHDGGWVDENSRCYPVSKRSIWRLDAEAAWQEMAKKLDTKLAIFRLSGIYGPGRNAFVNMEKGTARRLVKPGQVFNRVHRKDIGLAVKLAAAGDHEGIFNITDDEPAPPQDVVLYAHQLAGKEPPEEIDFETAELSMMARSFYGENKRVSNRKSKNVLGMEYRFPNYRSALRKLWEEEMWR